MDTSYPRLRIAVLYALFAIASIALNLGVQLLVNILFGYDESLWTGLVAGTGFGFLLKYYLDKRFIFRYRTDSLFSSVKVFVLYFITALFTTAFFWGMEYGFDRYLSDNNSRYFGGFIGLTGGYILKYQLDKKFVFNFRESDGK